MQILLADAKTMRAEKAPLEPVSLPVFGKTARSLAKDLGKLSVEELQALFGGSLRVNRETWERYRHFTDTEPAPAIFAFSGQAYRHLRAETLRTENLLYAQAHLFITSFLYGLLRPLDGIVPYRMEQNVRSKSSGDIPMNRFWRGLLTDFLIRETTEKDDGVLVQLSTKEFEQLFDWERVKKSCRVITPYFYVRDTDRSKLSTQAVWAKSCRGAMVRHILEHQLKDSEALKTFTYEGFAFSDVGSNDEKLIFIREDD